MIKHFNSYVLYNSLTSNILRAKIEYSAVWKYFLHYLFSQHIINIYKCQECFNGSFDRSLSVEILNSEVS